MPVDLLVVFGGVRIGRGAVTPPTYRYCIAIVSHSGFKLAPTFALILGTSCCRRSSFSLAAQAKEENMQSKRSRRIRILALVWPAALAVTLVVNPGVQAGTTGALETKLRLGGPVPVKSEPTKSGAASPIVESKEVKPVASSPKASQPKGDPPLLVQDAWVWRCDPTAHVAVWSSKALCEDFVVLR